MITAVDLEKAACIPLAPNEAGFNPKAKIPYGCTTEHIKKAMQEFVDFLDIVNIALNEKNYPRLETMLMPANFSSLVGEFVASGIPKQCLNLVRNRYHNGHPDLIQKGRFPKDAVQYASEGIEIKASRYSQAWQGHNPEDTWLMIFMFDCSRPSDAAKEVPPRPFRFLTVAGALLTKQDWFFSGRSKTSRRTITASVTKTGYEKIMRNWIYKAPELPQSKLSLL